MRRPLRRVLEMLTAGRSARVHHGLRDEAQDLRERSESWLRSKGIQGLGIARRTTAGETLPQLVLKVYVTRKLPKAECDALVPSLLRIAGLALDVEVDVEEVGEMSLHGLETPVRPVAPGAGISPEDGGAGTIGCIVEKSDGSSGTYLLGAGHAFLFGRSGAVGDRLFQPAIEDLAGGAPQSIGAVAVANDLTFGASGFTNVCDVALALLDPTLPHDRTIPGIGVPSGVHAQLRTGMSIQKTGRTTGHTIGQILDIDFQTAFPYRTDANGTTQRAGFRAQVLCTHYASGGDSGAAVLTTTGQLVGVHLGGSDTRSVFSRALPALNVLGVRLPGG